MLIMISPERSFSRAIGYSSEGVYLLTTFAGLPSMEPSKSFVSAIVPYRSRTRHARKSSAKTAPALCNNAGFRHVPPWLTAAAACRN